MIALALTCSVLVLTGVSMADGQVAPADPTDPASVARSGDGSVGGGPLLAGPDVTSTTRDAQRPGMRSGLGGAMQPTGVQMILQARCGSCHGPEKQKAGVRVVPVEAMFEGDRRDWVVVPGDPNASELFRRVSLPAGHEDVMPPDDGALGDLEIEKIRLWIEQGDTQAALITAAKAGERSNVDPRTWAAVYLSLDLKATQRRTAEAEIQALQKEMAELRKGRRGQGGNSAADSDEARKAARAGREAMSQRIGEVQKTLWAALTPAQQEAFRGVLSDPDALQQAREAGKQRQGRRGSRGAGRPRRPQ
jgi:hypothetical protein